MLVAVGAEIDDGMAVGLERREDRLPEVDAAVIEGDGDVHLRHARTKREQEITLANNLRERMGQVERALDRLDDGQYGWCEKCGNAIPVERLAAFPSATLCVSCKQLEERR